MGAASFVKINEEARRSFVAPEPPEPNDPLPEVAVVRVLDAKKLDPSLKAKDGDELEMSFTAADSCARLGLVEIVQGRDGKLTDETREALAQEAKALGVCDEKGKPYPISVLRKWKNDRLQKAIDEAKADADAKAKADATGSGANT